jgi:MoxR-like ATPase
MSQFDEMVSFLKGAWPARKFIVPCMVGPAGIGKTAAVKQAAEELGAGKVVTIIASQILPNEVSGITMPVPETKAMEIFDHYRLSSLQDGDILFFDELLEADQLVLSACLTLIESRQLMSGRQLPNIMIVAATNPTIKPNMLKENIRQRFVWRSFRVDPEGTRSYIRKSFGLDVKDLCRRLVETGNEYNILTPRSLTKMAQWMSLSANEDEATATAKTIDSVWQMGIGASLLEAWLKRDRDEMEELRQALVQATADANVELDILNDKDGFKQTSMAELMEILQALPEWEQIANSLQAVTIDEETQSGKVEF